MAVTKRRPTKRVRRSITLTPEENRQIHAIAKHRQLSDSRVLQEFVQQGIESAKQKEQAFFALSKRLRSASDPDEIDRLGNQLGRSIFGE